MVTLPQLAPARPPEGTLPKMLDIAPRTPGPLPLKCAWRSGGARPPPDAAWWLAGAPITGIAARSRFDPVRDRLRRNSSSGMPSPPTSSVRVRLERRREGRSARVRVAAAAALDLDRGERCARPHHEVHLGLRSRQ